jgi:biopolymer transport protein ExbD/biopolymer transport protein TolR
MKTPKAPSIVSDINVTPMVDVMLVVLIIFMVITPMLSKGANVDMVKARYAKKLVDADREDAILIAITRDGKIFVSPGNQQIGLDKLADRVKDLQTVRTSDKTVYIKADARARFESVTDVVDTLRTAGVDQLGLLTEQIQDKNKRAQI